MMSAQNLLKYFQLNVYTLVLKAALVISHCAFQISGSWSSLTGPRVLLNHFAVRFYHINYSYCVSTPYN